MNSDLFRLKAVDFAKGLITAALAAVLAALAQAMSVPGFDYASFNWQNLETIAVAAGLAYVVKNYFSDSTGAFLGRIG